VIAAAGRCNKPRPGNAVRAAIYWIAIVQSADSPSVFDAAVARRDASLPPATRASIGALLANAPIPVFDSLKDRIA